MKIGIIGLGRMGANIARRLMDADHECVVFDASAEAVSTLSDEGAQGVGSLDELIDALPAPRVIWLMLPAGDITEQTVETLRGKLGSDDTLIDGGNANFKDDVRRAEKLAEQGIHYVDVGVSGGVWGRERGYCLMIGGEQPVVEKLDPIFETLAPGKGDIDKTPSRATRDPRVEQGYMYCGPNGSGHFVKMVHNGIEYGMMQAFAEGFDILKNRNKEELPENMRYDIELADVAELWRRGSVISSWLLDLTSIALAEDNDLEGYSGKVNDSGEGRWTIEAAIEEAVPANVLSAALFTRFRSRSDNTYGEKLLSAMRKQFGGHVETPPDPKK
ncbi:phosphogluconate dehydrogenase (NAD(+)-dependent, decarboxylating) [Larsenimonas rhizosphaerae]|uniref:Decarboxylating 6-phosphogluconate dehydrogenase n=1 Tax=Larsenimonas rhizosphaerae TaxID=2944682 RepID=A0AA41ZG30_9GAMM|nr:decarboxylating 6-phosphogluconate dehydrogenase [Larsenimonas rhizosphaerae]MCM2132016.1 decarboxylating 6-phosphogluconate dehydrogenase [Larsenimonas rhizosphaerae]MCX2524619.1 decarboxylating 6-phosphogluconate dehydrogenase [Larsenimonas rhizosphaerae]